MTPYVGAPGEAVNVVLVEDGVDADLVWRHGNPVVKTHAIGAGDAVMDLSNRDILEVTGADRLGWLHPLTLQHPESLGAGESSGALVFPPNGHVEHVLAGVDNGTQMLAWTGPGRTAALMNFLASMRSMIWVEVRPRDDLRLTWIGGDVEVPGDWIRRSALGGREAFHPADAALPEGRPAGIWAPDAHCIALGVPRIFIDTDARTIPNEIGLFGTHLDKGCHRGQETAARVHNLSCPLRRLTLLHLDGTAEALPVAGSALEVGDGAVGFAGSSARHRELGPVVLALVKRVIPIGATLTADGTAAAQEVLVDPGVGLHFHASLHQS